MLTFRTKRATIGTSFTDKEIIFAVNDATKQKKLFPTELAYVLALVALSLGTALMEASDFSEVNAGVAEKPSSASSCVHPSFAKRS